MLCFHVKIVKILRQIRSNCLNRTSKRTTFSCFKLKLAFQSSPRLNHNSNKKVNLKSQCRISLWNKFKSLFQKLLIICFVLKYFVYFLLLKQRPDAYFFQMNHTIIILALSWPIWHQNKGALQTGNCEKSVSRPAFYRAWNFEGVKCKVGPAFLICLPLIQISLQEYSEGTLNLFHFWSKLEEFHYRYF